MYIRPLAKHSEEVADDLPVPSKNEVFKGEGDRSKSHTSAVDRDGTRDGTSRDARGAPHPWLILVLGF